MKAKVIMKDGDKVILDTEILVGETYVCPLCASEHSVPFEIEGVEQIGDELILSTLKTEVGHEFYQNCMSEKNRFECVAKMEIKIVD